MSITPFARLRPTALGFFSFSCHCRCCWFSLFFSCWHKLVTVGCTQQTGLFFIIVLAVSRRRRHETSFTLVPCAVTTVSSFLGRLGAVYFKKKNFRVWGKCLLLKSLQGTLAMCSFRYHGNYGWYTDLSDLRTCGFVYSALSAFIGRKFEAMLFF